MLHPCVAIIEESPNAEPSVHLLASDHGLSVLCHRRQADEFGISQYDGPAETQSPFRNVRKEAYPTTHWTTRCSLVRKDAW